jgi:hypothetical protein
VAFVRRNGEAQQLEGDELQKAMDLGAEVARRGRWEPMILWSMQSTAPLSCDLGAAGPVGWKPDETGTEVVNRKGEVLTLNAQTAARYGVSRGVAETKAEVAALLGLDAWQEVAPSADARLRDERLRVKAAETQVLELRAKKRAALDRVTAAQTQEQRMESLQVAGRTDAEINKIFAKWPKLREYWSAVAVEDIPRNAPGRGVPPSGG